jgi:hypothetical protein
MFEFHGWATLRDSAGTEDLHDDPSAATIAAVRELVAQAGGHNRVADLRGANGDWHLWIAGFHNHRQPAITDLFEQVAALAPGSYGLLHIHDDEDPGKDNDWIVWVMRRGRVTQEPDRFLSPHIGAVEDAAS